MHTFSVLGLIIGKMPLKYQAQLALCTKQPCPCPTKFQARPTTAFRFMNRAATPMNFRPIAVIDGRTGPAPCEHYSLSFFRSVREAQQKYALLAQREDAASRYGDVIGRVDVLAVDGVISMPNSKGHMDLHENEGVEFAPRVTEYHPVREEV